MIVYLLGILVIAALCAYELRKPEVHEWVRRRRQNVRRLWHDLFNGDA